MTVEVPAQNMNAGTLAVIHLLLDSVSEDLIQSLFKKENPMSQAVILCPKCQGEMIQGYVLDFTPVGGRVRQWNSGPPKKFWNCILDSTSQIPIGTFRCQSCGFLESYAREEFTPK